MQERLPSSRAAGDEPGREGQDEIDATKAPLLDHLIELRSRLIWALASFVLMFFLCFSSRDTSTTCWCGLTCGRPATTMCG